MPNQFRSLDRIKVESPCEADWDSMIGNDVVRFCEHCNLHVNNLSEMTQSKAKRFIARSKGRICVRYISRPDGSVATKHSPEKLYGISRRVSRIAAGAFSATLSLASATAQTRSTQEVSPVVQIAQAREDKISASEGTAMLAGKVIDPVGAVVPRATITLINSAGHTTYNMTTSDTGAYSFSFLTPGVYDLAVERTGFSRTEIQKVILNARDSQSLDLRLDLPTIMAQVEIIAEPFDSVTVTSGAAIIVSPEEPLVRAAADNDLELVKQLVFSTPDVNVQDQHTEMTALDHSVENGNFEIARTLLAAGANVRARNGRQRTALMYLGEKATPALVRELLAAGAKVNEHDESGETVLMNAAAASSVAVVRVLTEAGAKIGAKDDDEKTALMFAVRNEDTQVAKLLIDMGVDVNARDNNGETALIAAAEDGAAATVRALIEAGADVNAKNNSGFTALINAAAEGNLESVKLLLNAGADLSASDEDRRTALAWAIKLEKVEVIGFLKSLGAPE